MQALLDTVITTGHSGSKSKSKFAETDQQLPAKSDRAIAPLRSIGRFRYCAARVRDDVPSVFRTRTQIVPLF